MKKVLYLISAVTVLMVACTKSEIKDSSKPDCFVGNIKLSATHENGIVGKTTLESGDAVNWAAGDRISVLWNGGSVKSSAAASAGTTAEFSAEVESSPEYAVYPAFEPDASEGFRASWDGNTLSVTVPAVQDGSFASAAIEVAKIGAVSGSTGKRPVDFKNLGSLLEFSVESGVTKAVITAYGGKTIAGTASVSFGDDGLPIIGGSITDAGSVITLEGLSGIGPFYVATLPATLSDGFYIALYDSSDQKIGERFTGKSIALDRRKLVALGSIASTTISGTFVKVTAPDGSDGSGSSWENAMSWASFKSTPPTGKVFFAEGTYTVTSNSGWTVPGTSDFEVYGGYPSDASGSDLSGRNTESNPTIFDGEKKRRIFVWNNANIKTVFDGVTFQNASTVNYASVGCALVLENLNSASFNNCIIKDNKNDNATANSGIVRTKLGTVKFTNCTFSGNIASKSGGVFCHNANTSTVNCTIDGCTFINNSIADASENYGGVFYLWSASATTTITNCTFTGNHAAAGLGGVVYLNGGTLNISNCRFNDNYASEGGVCYATAGTIISSNNTFTGNSAIKSGSVDVGGGCWRVVGQVNLDLINDTYLRNQAFQSPSGGSGAAIYAGGSKAYVIRAHKCLFMHNKSGSRGTVRNAYSGGTLFLNACSFYKDTVVNYASAVHNNGKCALHNCALHLNVNTSASNSPSTIFIGGSSKMLVSNTSIRLYGSSTSGIYTNAGPATLVNNTVINSFASDDATKGAALKTKVATTSYGHNIFSKVYQESGDTYSLESNEHTDVVYSLSQQWIDTPYYLIKWTDWNTGDSRPAGFVEAAPSRVTAAIEAYDSVNGTALKTWLQSDDLKINGKTALEYDIRGIARSTTAIWPGSYDNSGATPQP